MWLCAGLSLHAKPWQVSIWRLRYIASLATAVRKLVCTGLNTGLHICTCSTWRCVADKLQCEGMHLETLFGSQTHTRYCNVLHILEPSNVQDPSQKMQIQSHPGHQMVQRLVTVTGQSLVTFVHFLLLSFFIHRGHAEFAVARFCSSHEGDRKEPQFACHVG